MWSSPWMEWLLDGVEAEEIVTPHQKPSIDVHSALWVDLESSSLL